MQLAPEDAESPAHEDHQEGGPVKSFLEHLEDLRWVLVKSVSAILVGMLVCMVAGNKLVAVLMWPLDHAPQITRATNIETNLPVLLGTNKLGTISTGAFTTATGVTNHFNSLQITPVMVGTNLLLAFRPETNSAGLPRNSRPVIKTYTPLGGIMVALKLAIYGGLIVAAPFVMYFVGSFILPALRVREKQVLYKAVAFGSVLFFLGVAFCYFVLAGVAIVATVEFSQWLGFGADEWRAEEYISFMCRFMIGMGLGFELPVVILTAVKIGLIDYRTLVRFRSYAVIGNLVLAAVATPSGDPFTMFLMAIPLQILYEASVVIAWYWDRRDRKALPA
jgi:sec-independent protein translocase protein TatC